LIHSYIFNKYNLLLNLGYFTRWSKGALYLLNGFGDIGEVNLRLVHQEVVDLYLVLFHSELEVLVKGIFVWDSKISNELIYIYNLIFIPIFVLNLSSPRSVFEGYCTNGLISVFFYFEFH
jgi:hypothetical protein